MERLYCNGRAGRGTERPLLKGEGRTLSIEELAMFPAV